MRKQNFIDQKNETQQPPKFPDTKRTKESFDTISHINGKAKHALLDY